MKNAADEIGDNFQVIVLDHAHLRDEWFENALVEEWRDGVALVPANWIE